MGRPTLAPALVALVALLAPAPASAAVQPPAPAPLRSGWQLSMGLAPGAWRPTTVPGVFDGRPLPSEFGGTVGWYRVTFTGPRAPAGFGWVVRFGSVRRVAQAWLNGVPIGTHADPYVPFDLPARGLRPARPNTLLVRVDNRKAPRNPREGWWNWGGIVRPVQLVPVGRVVLADPGLMYQGDGSELFDGWLTNRSATPLSPTVAVVLRSPGGQTTRVVRPAGLLLPGATHRLRFAFHVARPDLWAPGRPRLYDATIATSAGGRVEQRDRMRIGLRTVRVVGGMLQIDGRPVDLRGASIVEDVPGRGPALTDADVARIVARLKAVHADVTRSHYLLDPRLLDALDAAGIAVWSQAPIYHRDRLLVTAAQRAAALATVRGTVLAARDHPSVIAHSVANEPSVVPDQVPGTRAFLDAARQLVGDLDPTVPPAVDLLSYPGYPRQETFARFPLLGINSYFGWYPGKAAHPTGDLGELRPYLLRMRRMYPRSAMVMTEFGAEATRPGPADQKQTYAFQSRFVDRTLKIVDGLPFMGGAIYWTLQEFAVKPYWDGGAKLPGIAVDSIHNKGLISYAGTPKPAFAVAARDFASVPVFRPLVGPPRPTAPLTWFLVVLLPLAILALLAIAAWALRDVWRLTRPPRARVLSLPERRAA